MSEWTTRRLGELVKFYSGGTPNKSKAEYWNGDIPWISAKTMKSDHVSTSELFITQAGLESGSKLAPAGSLLLLTRGSGLFNGIPICYVDSPVAYNQDVKCIQSVSEVSEEYIYYWFKANSGTLQKQLDVTGIGAGKFDTKFLENLEVSYPDKETRDKLVYFASCIFEKISTNKKINKNLADQSQVVLCRYMEQFPVVMKSLGEFTDIIDCLHSKKPERVNDTDKQLIQLDNILDTGFLDLTKKYYISEEDYQNWTRKCEIQEGDCVITNVGRIGAVSQAPAGTHAAMGRNMTCVRLKRQYPYPSYLITAFLSQHIRTEIKKNTDEGTIMGALNVKNIPLLQFPYFEENIMQSIEGSLYPLRKSIEMNYQENQKLASLRDSLLPRLMSGELDVSNIEI